MATACEVDQESMTRLDSKKHIKSCQCLPYRHSATGHTVSDANMALVRQDNLQGRQAD